MGITIGTWTTISGSSHSRRFTTGTVTGISTPDSENGRRNRRRRPRTERSSGSTSAWNNWPLRPRPGSSTLENVTTGAGSMPRPVGACNSKGPGVPVERSDPRWAGRRVRETRSPRGIDRHRGRSATARLHGDRVRGPERNPFGFTDAENRRSRSEFACQRCGNRNHADYNAAKNVADAYLRRCPQSQRRRGVSQYALKSGTVHPTERFTAHDPPNGTDSTDKSRERAKRSRGS